MDEHVALQSTTSRKQFSTCFTSEVFFFWMASNVFLQTTFRLQQPQKCEVDFNLLQKTTFHSFFQTPPKHRLDAKVMYFLGKA